MRPLFPLAGGLIYCAICICTAQKRCQYFALDSEILEAPKKRAAEAGLPFVGKRKYFSGAMPSEFSGLAE